MQLWCNLGADYMQFRCNSDATQMQCRFNLRYSKLNFDMGLAQLQPQLVSFFIVHLFCQAQFQWASTGWWRCKINYPIKIKSIYQFIVTNFRWTKIQLQLPFDLSLAQYSPSLLKKYSYFTGEQWTILDEYKDTLLLLLYYTWWWQSQLFLVV